MRRRDPRSAGGRRGAVRLRIWLNPRSVYNNEARVLQQARTLEAKGLRAVVDFHYSDTWADPGKRYEQAAWSTHALAQLQEDVYDHTYDVCTALEAQGTVPGSAQIGNEIDVGTLWNEGKVVNGNFAPLAALLKSGCNAVKAGNSATRVVIHTVHADSNSKARWFFDGISATAYPFTTADADGFPNSIPGTTTCDGDPRHVGGAGGAVHLGAEHRAQRRGDRRLLLGAHLDGREGQRLEPRRHRRQRQRVGGHGRLRLERPGQPAHPLDLVTAGCASRRHDG